MPRSQKQLVIPTLLQCSSLADEVNPSSSVYLLPKKLEASTKIPSELSMIGSLELMAGASEGTPEQKQDKLFLSANSGRPMDLNGYPYPVVVDMQGARFDKAVTPLIGDHDTKQRFGHTVAQAIVPYGQTGTIDGRSVKGPLIAAVGVRSSASDFAKGVESDAKQKFPFQVSIGAKIKDGYVVEEGDSVTVNGQSWNGPLIVASKTNIRELTITVLGADSNTSAVIAAKSKQGESSMNFSEWLKSLHLEESTLSAEATVALKAQHQAFLKAQETNLTPVKEDKKVPGKKTIKASANDTDEDGDEPDPKQSARGEYRDMMASETLRINSINAMSAKFPTLTTLKLNNKEHTLAEVQAHAIKEGWEAERLELECRRADYPQASFNPGIHVQSGNYDSRAVEIGILRACGVTASSTNAKSGAKYGYEHQYDQKALEASDNPRYRMSQSLDELLDMTIRASGNFPVARSGGDLFAQAHKVWSGLTNNGANLDVKASGFSNLVLTNILENVANKSAMISFQAVENVWNQICARRPSNDFKPQSLYTLDLDGSFKKVGPDGELKHITMRDSKKTVSPETFGAMITIDRKTRINDDLNMVVSKASSLGTLGAIRIEESVFVLLLSNPSSFFHADNGNLMSGGTSALGIDSLQTAKLIYSNQTLYGKPITVAPRILLTGTVNQQQAERLYTLSSMGIGYGNTDTGLIATNNPHVGMFKPVISGWINNTSIKDQDGAAITGQSSTAWYLMADPNTPQGSALVISFLNGRETPYFDQAETQFNVVGGIQMRSYLDWGVAMHLTQMAVKSAGA